MPKAKAKTILGCTKKSMNKPDVAAAAIVFNLVIWILMCVGIWFIARHNLETYAVKLTGMTYKFDVTGAADEILTKATLYTTLILGILQLLLMIWPTIEHLFVFHKIAGMKDAYKWWACPIVATIIGLIAIVIAEGIVFQLGWITLIQIVALLVVNFIPRLIFQP